MGDFRATLSDLQARIDEVQKQADILMCRPVPLSSPEQLSGMIYQVSILLSISRTRENRTLA